MQKPSRRYYRSLVNYIWNERPIVQNEAQFLRVRDDFVQLSERSDSPLEHIIDHLICNWVPTAWLRVSAQQGGHTSTAANTWPRMNPHPNKKSKPLPAPAPIPPQTHLRICEANPEYSASSPRSRSSAKRRTNSPR